VKTRRNGKQCPKCGGLGFLRVNVPPGDPDFGKVIPCDCRAEEVKEQRIRRLCEISGMMEAELSLTLDKVIDRPDTARMARAAREFVDDPFGFLTVWGGVGNGKTLVLQATVNELREKQGMVGAYVTFKDLIDFVRGGFDDDAFGERQRYDFLKNIPCLAIDEIDKARMTAYSAEFRSAFLDYRYRLAWNGRAVTLFAMNCDPSEMPPPVYDRLRDGRFVIVRNRDASLRPALTR